MAFRLKNHYSRKDIHRILKGGSVQAYFPNKKGMVLCACLSMDHYQFNQPMDEHVEKLRKLTESYKTLKYTVGGLW